MKILQRLRKRWRFFLALFLLTGFVAWLLLGLYFLFYSAGVYPRLVDYPLGLYAVPCQNPPTITLSGNTLFLGDLHLRASDGPTRFAGLAELVRRENISSLILVGDLFDSLSDAKGILSDGSDEEQVQAISRALGIEEGPLHMYFVRGSPVHDPPDLELTVQGESRSFVTAGKCARFLVDGVAVTALHGDDAFGGFHGLLFAYLAGSPVLEGWWKERMALDHSEWVVMAHSHVPGIDERRRVANTGGWTDLLGLGPPKGRGVLVSEGKVTLVQISP